MTRPFLFKGLAYNPHIAPQIISNLENELFNIDGAGVSVDGDVSLDTLHKYLLFRARCVGNGSYEINIDIHKEGSGADEGLLSINFYCTEIKFDITIECEHPKVSCSQYLDDIMTVFRKDWYSYFGERFWAEMVREGTKDE